MSTKTVRRLVLGLMFLCLAFLGVLGVAQTPASSDLLVVRTISTACALPESVFLVTLHVEVGEDLQGVGIEETLPYGWKIHPLENDGAAFKRSQSQWTFSGKIKAGSKIDICYEVTIPAAEKLYADTLPECFSITGIFQSKVPAFETTVTGDSDVEVVSSLPVMSAIAHLVPASEKHPVDVVDLRLGQKITREQFARAMDLWRTDGVIPATGGETIDLTLMEKIVSYYETCTPVDELLPLADDSALQAVRTITTFLPSDTVLLPNGCLDPGIQARQLVVTVEVTAEHDAYGAGLREWFPAGWHVTPLKNDGFVYRPSHAEWIYPERLAAGEKRTIVYQVETAPTPPEGMDCEVGCCGQDTRIVGTISAALGCGEHDVTGEDTVHIWQCLPVILAISRWDASDDSLDVTLSNNISFPQVQRAVAFWQQSAAVPYTCGYTVGYETLKTIVAHWLTGTPVTEALPGGEPAATPTRAAPGSYKWFCQMKDEQPSDDLAKVPTSPVAVNAQVDRQLTCLWPVATLTATVSGGLPPYKFVWKDSEGNKIGSDKDITVDKSGTYVVTVSSAGCCAGSDFVTVTQDIVPPTVSAGSDQLLTCAVTSVTLDGSASGGTPPYTYLWVDAAENIVGKTEDVTIDQPGTYTLIATGANGCSGSDSVVVDQDIVPPTVSAGPDQLLTCAVTSVTLDGSASGGTAPYAYAWTNLAGVCVGKTEDMTVDQPGTYTLMVTGANGCLGSDSVIVTQDIVSPTVDAGPDKLLTCAVTSVTLDGAMSGGTPPYTYSWVDAAGNVVGKTEDMTVDQPGTYMLTVTGANGCAGSDSVIVTQDIVPPTVSAGSDQLLTCTVTSITLDGSASGGTPPYTYSWVDGAENVVGKTEDITVDQPGTYTLMMTGANGCAGSDSVIVTQDIVPPTVSAGSDQLLTCTVTSITLDGSASGGTPPYTYSWVDGAGNIVGTTEEVTVDQPGEYTLTVTGANGCSASDSVTVTQDIVPPTVNAGLDQLLTCAVTSVTLDGSASSGTAPYTYAWTNLAGVCVGKTEDMTADQPGTYTLTVSGVNGCSASDNVVVGQDIVPPTVSAGPDQLLTCAVTSVTLDGSASGGTSPYTYAWRDASGNVVGTTEDMTVDRPGTYTLTVTGANGCSATDSVVVGQDIVPPTVSAGPDQLLTCAVISVTLDGLASGGTTAPYTYSWIDGAGNVVGKTEDITVDQPGTYTLIATGANGCSANDSVVVHQDIAPPTVDAGPDQTITCANTTAKLDATVSSGKPPYTYEWRNSSGDLVGCTEDVIVDQPGVYTLTATGLNGCRTNGSVAVNEDVTPPTIGIVSSASILTCLVDQIALKAEVNGGCGTYEYSWENSEGDELGCTDEIIVHTPDMYVLIVTGANGCSANATITITQDIVSPTVTAGPDRVLDCAVTSVTLNGSASAGAPPYTYVWMDPTNNVIDCTQDVTVDQPGTYVVSVTGANGCSATDSVTVTQDIVPPTVDAGLDQVLTCCVTSVTLDGLASGGTPPYTYSWVDAAGNVVCTSEDATVDQPGTYALSATGANGCSAIDTVTVTQDVAEPAIDIIDPQTLSCLVTSVTLDGSAHGGTPPYKYVWSDSNGSIVGTTEDIDVSEPGKYTLTVTGANCCSASFYVTVDEDIEPPLVDAGPDRELTCLVDAVTLSVYVSGGKQPYLFLWRDEQGAILSTEQALVVQSPGTYRMTVVGANGCCASDEVVVSKNTISPNVDAGLDKTITCANLEAHIDATISGGQEPYGIKWLNDCGDTVATTEDITVTLPGVYTLLVTGANGCAASDTVTVADGIVPPQVDAGADKVLTCENEEVLLDATVSGGAYPYTYRWTNSCGAVVGDTEDLTVTLPSVYTLTVTSADGCVGSDSVEVKKEE